MQEKMERYRPVHREGKALPLIKGVYSTYQEVSPRMRRETLRIHYLKSTPPIKRNLPNEI